MCVVLLYCLCVIVYCHRVITQLQLINKIIVIIIISTTPTHNTLYTTHSTLYTTHSTLYTTHSKQPQSSHIHIHSFTLQSSYINNNFNIILIPTWDRDSSVHTATRYGLEGTGIESRWGRARFFPAVSTVAGNHAAFYTMCAGLFLGGGGKGAGAWR
jgi:hypothetical protein